MLALDSLVLDLIFEADASPTETLQDVLIDVLGELAGSRQILDPDMQDPRFELELSPSMPFRQRGQRRLLLIDPTVAPMRPDPRTDPVYAADLRPEKERMIELCTRLGLRAARLNGLGMWGDAALAAKSAQDLRGLALIAWVLDPGIGVDGVPRATRLSPAEFEEKLLAYDKRLEELDEKQILANVGGARLERRGDYLILDVLDENGHWDLRHSLAMEQALAAIDRFSMIPGAPQGEVPSEEPAAPPESEPEPEPAGPELGVSEIDGRLLLVFPRERFDLNIAAAMGKRDWDAVVRRADPLAGPQRDALYREGAFFIAPLEFLSEVFVDGKPLSKPTFESESSELEAGVRALPVHCPRFGQVLLLEMPGKGRFISSALEHGEALPDVIRGHFT